MVLGRLLRREAECRPDVLHVRERTPRAAFQCVVFEGLEEWMTGQLIYPAVWWEHDAAGLRDPRLADLEERLSASD